MKNIAGLIILITCFHLGFGQLYDKQKIIQELKTVTENYHNPGYLSFDVDYKYANEKHPLEVLDSLKGSFKISGHQYWYSIDQTETVGNAEYVIMLFKEDQVMYVTKPSMATGTQNPLTLMDSILLVSDSIQAQLTQKGKDKSIIFQFRPGMRYKSVEYHIASSGYITKMKCVVRADALYDPSVKELIEDDDTYAIIEASFNNYNKSGTYTNQPDINKYFRKVGDAFIPEHPFENYKIFLGSTNL